MPEVIYEFDLPAFTGRNVPIKEIAAAIGKDAQVGLQQGILKFGTAIKIADSSEYSYYCSDKRVWEEIMIYLWLNIKLRKKPNTWDNYRSKFMMQK